MIKESILHWWIMMSSLASRARSPQESRLPSQAPAAVPFFFHSRLRNLYNRQLRKCVHRKGGGSVGGLAEGRRCLRVARVWLANHSTTRAGLEQPLGVGRAASVKVAWC